ncbi:tRNA threonylcarbamoyladenosine biosynthesis protein [Thermosulfidibacter takaii ABI70S6]|uniref:L-threonylcarbamoyladenylate synthase n=1 Tax=Thermosulfidibacter takaii (strain DSM 17441 / JCM 13301 / NBRC 103674 / ABI70S6) TaxID=1298851 RepID=A0A0S3QTX4_THET7|nr:L-threonylcarbamoyladenylate synthase [Thermosulfidibacter takaii]BAT71770.1 tRNA threonylcarbamoyladenosine biosynthesis protein [Thermosulfidibacter takaii ABI70S6]
MKLINVDHEGAIELAYNALKVGKVIIFPTDTLYGLLADIENVEAVQKVFSIKNRPLDKPVPVLVGSLEIAQLYGIFSEIALVLWRHFLPGPLTVVVPAKKSLAGAVSEERKIGLRMPDYEPLLKVLRRLERGVTGTSANFSYEPPAKTTEELSKALVDEVDLVFYDDKPLLGKPSTVVEIEDRSVRILRHGAISEEEIRNVLRGENCKII